MICIGIDVSKAHLDVSEHGEKRGKRFANNTEPKFLCHPAPSQPKTTRGGVGTSPCAR